jgi:hypothetical protein
VSFTVTEAATPTVMLGAIDLSSACVVSGNAWTCNYTTTGNEYPPNSEQTAAVVVEVLDASSNRVSASTSVVFDYQPPSIQSVAIDPEATGLGRAALLTLAASEPLAPGFEPQLMWSPPINFIYETARSTPFQHVFRYDVTSLDVSGVYRLQQATLLDLAGNETTVTVNPALEWLLDNVAPEISNVEVDVDAASLNLPETTPPRINGDPSRTVRITFTVNEENPNLASARVGIGAIDIPIAARTRAHRRRSTGPACTL